MSCVFKEGACTKIAFIYTYFDFESSLLLLCVTLLCVLLMHRYLCYWMDFLLICWS